MRLEPFYEMQLLAGGTAYVFPLDLDTGWITPHGEIRDHEGHDLDCANLF